MPSTGCRICCSYPHGPLSIIGNIVGFLAWAVGWGSMWSCCYVKQTFTNGPDRCFGFFLREYFVDSVVNNYETDYNCNDWTNAQTNAFDGMWKTGRAFAAIAQPMGFITMCILFSSGCVAFHPTFMKVGGIVMFLIGLFKFLELIALATDICESNLFGGGNSCSFSSGAGASIGSGVLWFVTGCITLSLKEARPGPDDIVHTPGTAATATPVAAAAATTEAEPGTVTTTELNLPDGTRRVTTTTVNADGSKTVTETIEEAPAVKADVM